MTSLTSPKSNQPTGALFSLIYSERSTSSDALISLVGPSIHSSVDEAVLCVYEYVKDRISDDYDDFVEWAEEELPNWSLTSEDFESDDQLLESTLDNVGEHAHVIVDWYFASVNDDCCEAFYKIDQHEITSLSVALGDQDEEGDVVTGTVEFGISALFLRLDGHTDCASIDDKGIILGVEVDSGEAVVRVFSDINDEAPTHNISLKGARSDQRIVN